MTRCRALILILVVLPAGAWTAGAADRTVPQSQVQIQLSYAPVVRRAAPAVVNIYGRSPTDTGITAAVKNNPAYRRYFGAEEEGPQNPLGSGVIVDPNGTIVTNEHVIRDAGGVTVVLSDRRQFDAVIERADERTDLAVIKIEAGEPLPFLEIGDSDELEVGDIVLAIGNPFGVGQSVTSGIVSALGRTVNGINDYRTFIQTDAAINPGNSGGALVSLDGKLIGINTALYSEGGGSVGIAFAIPTVLVRGVLVNAGAGQRLVRPWLGAVGQTVTARLARRLGLPKVSGMLVETVAPGGPTASAGLAPGDVVLTVDGRPVDDQAAFQFRFATLPVGTTARLGIWRQGVVEELPVKLIAPPEMPARDVTQIKLSPLTGATVANLSPALADELQVEDANGIIVLDVPKTSPAARLHIKVSDILLTLNGQSVDTVGDLQHTLLRVAPPVRVGLRRDGRTLILTGSE